MRSMRLIKPIDIEGYPLEMMDIDKPEPDRGQIRIKISACGMCHTDLHIVEGDIKPSLMPITPGHQVVGRVDAIGLGVEKFKIGERVGIPWLYDACQQCEFCLRGSENLCPNARFTGFNVDGGFSEYMLAESAYALSIPESYFRYAGSATFVCWNHRV